MSNTEASDENIESPSTYVGEAYKEYRKNEKRKREKKKANTSGGVAKKTRRNGINDGLVLGAVFMP